MEQESVLSNRILLGGAVAFVTVAAVYMGGTFLERVYALELPMQLAMYGPFAVASLAVATADRWYVRRRNRKPGAQ